MSNQSEWDSYFFPPPHNDVMRNIPGIDNAIALSLFEYNSTAFFAKKLRRDPGLIAHTYDAEHLKAIHGYLFQEVYDWAGEYRTVNMGKNMTVFADAKNGGIDHYLNQATRKIQVTEWGSLNRREFAEAASEVFANLNYAHCFREGNGRTNKIFMQHVAEMSNFQLDYGRVSKEVWNQRSMFSGPDRGSTELHPEELYQVFEAIATPRETPHETQLDAEDEKSQQIYQQIMNGFTGPTGANQQQTPQTPNRNIDHGLNRESGYGLGD